MNNSPDAMNSFEQLVTNHEKQLIAYITSIMHDNEMAKDIAQETFIQAYKNYDRYIDFGKPLAWLKTIAKNICYRQLNKESKQGTISLFSLMHDRWDEESPQLINTIVDCSIEMDTIITQNELKHKILDAISKLPKEQGQVLYFRYYMGFSIKQVAKITGLPFGSIKSKSHYGLKKVKASLAYTLLY